MFQHPYTVLLSAFIERWQLDMNNFHRPFGRMTIILHNAELILSIPTYGPVDTKQTPEQLLGIVNSDFDIRYTMMGNDYFQCGCSEQKDVIHACEDMRSGVL